MESIDSNLKHSWWMKEQLTVVELKKGLGNMLL